MEKYDKVRKIGRGTFGDVLLVERKSDQQVSFIYSFYHFSILVICHETSAI